MKLFQIALRRQSFVKKLFNNCQNKLQFHIGYFTWAKYQNAWVLTTIFWSSLLGLCKIDSWIWTFFSFVLHMMTWWSVSVMVPTVFDKTQARARKSIFCLKSYKNVVVNHLELIRDKLKIFFEGENLGLN